MVKKYTYPEEEPQMAKEDIAINYPSNSVADAIWTLIVNQTEEVQSLIAERLSRLHLKSTVEPYTIAELNSRIDMAEQQMVDGDIVSGEFVHERMRNIIESM